MSFAINRYWMKFDGVTNKRDTNGKSVIKTHFIYSVVLQSFPFDLHWSGFICSNMLNVKRRRTAVSLQDKYDALKQIESGISRQDIMDKYGVKKNTVSDWISAKEKIIKAVEYSNRSSTKKYDRKSPWEKVDEALYKWFVLARANGIPVSGHILLEKGMQYGRTIYGEGFQISESWIDRWKGRRGIGSKHISGESLKVTPEMTASWFETTLPTIVSRFELADIFNADEFGLFYAAPPNASLHLKSEKCKGGKLSKNRLTGLVCASATGEKLPLLVIGKSKKPRCFKGVQNLPCEYRSQSKSWMTGDLFIEWLSTLDRKFVSDARKVLMMVDNCPAHPDVPNLKAITLTFLPPNTTSKLQPMDQGVIRSLKAYYRKDLVRSIIHHFEQFKTLPKINVLNAMLMMKSAWENVSEATIVNCFRKSGISMTMQRDSIADSDDPFPSLLQAMDDLSACETGCVQEGVSPEAFVDFDEGVEIFEASTSQPNDEEILATFCTSTTPIDVEEKDDNEEICDLIDDKDELPTRPSDFDFTSALITLQNFALFASKETSDVINTSIKAMRGAANEERYQKKCKQTSISDYFQ